MFTVVITEKGGAQRRMEFEKAEVTIGRVQGNDIILPKGNVSKRHSRIVLKDNRFIVVDLKSTNGTYVNGRKITSPLVVKPGDKIYIGDFIMTVEDGPSSAAADFSGPPAEPPPLSPERQRKPTEQAAPPVMYQPPSGPPPLPSQSGMPGGMQSSPPMHGAPPPLSSNALAPMPQQSNFDLDRDPMMDDGMQTPPPSPAPLPPPLQPPPSAPQPMMGSSMDRGPMMAQPMMGGPGMSSPGMSSPVPMGPPMMGTPPSSPMVAMPPAMPNMDSRDYSSPRAPISGSSSPSHPISSSPASGHPISSPPSSPPGPMPSYSSGDNHGASRSAAPPRNTAPPARGFDGALRAVMAHLATRFDVHDVHPNALQDQDRWAACRAALQATLRDLGPSLGDADRDALAAAAEREAVGLGALQDLLSNDSVREIVVEGARRVLADYGSGLEPVDAPFSSNDAVLTIARRLLAQAGRGASNDPIQEAALPYGPHVTVVLPPVAVRGPIIEIRRMGRGLTLDELVRRGMLDAATQNILEGALRARRNVIVAGPVGSGVTSLLGAIASRVDPQERLVTVEAVPDLSIDGPRSVALGTGEPHFRMGFGDLTKQAARMRADRLVVDDVMGSDVLAVLAAVSARPTGNLVGVHLNGATRAEDALESQVRLNTQGDADAVRELVRSTVHVIVQVDRAGNGQRRVTRVAEISGGGSTQDLVLFDGQSFSSTGNRASFM
jgi:pilus assembly protein CpaF